MSGSPREMDTDRRRAELEARLVRAAMALARDVTACEALLRGLPVQRGLLDPTVLAAIGEPLDGEPLELGEELALRVQVAWPRSNAAQEQLGEPASAWQDPAPLRPGSHGPLPVFPLEALPAWQAEWAAAIAAEKGTSPDLPACLALGLTAGGIQRRVIVVPRRGFEEPTSLYMLPALPPGQGKSPVFNAALRPIRALELGLVTEWEAAQAEWEAAAELRDRKRRELVGVKLKEEGPLEAAAQELAELAPIEPPARPRFLTDDVTPEKLGALIGEHGRIVAASDEGAALFENLAGRYAQGGSSSWDTYNKAHSGSTLIVDRRSAGPIVVNDAALTLIVTTQPTVVLDLHGKPGTAGRGVLARPLYALPAPVWPEAATPEAPGAIVNCYLLRMKRLWERTPDVRNNEDSLPEPVRLTFADEAAAVFQEWELSLRARVRARVEDGDTSAGVGWLAKLAGQTARLAACLHVADHWTSDVEPWAHELPRELDAATVRRAVAIARYFAAHAAAVFRLAEEDAGLVLAARVLAWLGRREEPATMFSSRDVHRALGRGRDRRAQFDAALERLADCGYVRPAEPDPQSGPGRPRSSPRWEPHPRLEELLAEPAHAVSLHTPSDNSDSPTTPGTTSSDEPGRYGENGLVSDTAGGLSEGLSEASAGRKPHSQAAFEGFGGMSEPSAGGKRRGVTWEPADEPPRGFPRSDKRSDKGSSSSDNGPSSSDNGPSSSGETSRGAGS